MEIYESIIEKDYFKIGREGKGKVKKMNKDILFIVISSIVLYISLKIINAFTDYGRIGDLNDYIYNFRRNNSLSMFGKVKIGIQIKPSYNMEKNLMYINSYKNQSASSIDKVNSFTREHRIQPLFYQSRGTRKTFPRMDFSEDSVPLGDSINMCVGVQWGHETQTMKPVENFPICGTTLSKKFIWNEDDTIYGTDVPVWIQHIYKAECDEKMCPYYCESNFEGIFVNGKRRKLCYSYDVLESVCIVIKWNKYKKLYEFYGGCFPGNSTYKMTQAVINKTYLFEDVKVEIRDYDDPVIKAGELTDYSFNFTSHWTIVALMIKISFFGLFIFIGYIIYEIGKVHIKLGKKKGTTVFFAEKNEPEIDPKTGEKIVYEQAGNLGFF